MRPSAAWKFRVNQTGMSFGGISGRVAVIDNDGNGSTKTHPAPAGLCSLRMRPKIARRYASATFEAGAGEESGGLLIF